MIKHVRMYIISHHRQLAKFVTIGITTCLVYLFVFHLFYGYLRFDYRIGATIAYIITVVTHFILNRAFTFSAVDQEVIHNLWKYMLMLLVNYLSLLVVMWVMVNLIQGSPYLGVIFSTLWSAAINFFMMKYFVFEQKKILQGL